MASRDYQSPSLAAASAVRQTAAEVASDHTHREAIPEISDVQYNGAVDGGSMKSGSSFVVRYSPNHVVMATAQPLAGDKNMYVLDEHNSMCKAMIPPSSTASTLKDSAIITTTNEVPN